MIDIDDDVNDYLDEDAWVRKMVANENEGEVDAQMREELLVEAETWDTDVFMDDGETVVVDTPSFTGSHVASPDGHVDETGFYIHDETDWELEIGCPIDVTRLEDEVREYHGGEHPGVAALTVSERNPSLGGGRRL